MLPWYGYVLLSALVLAAADIVRKHILRHEHPLEQLAAEAPFRLLAIALLIPFIGLPTPTQFLIIFGASLVLFALLLERNKAFRHLPISSVAPLQNVSPLILIVMAMLLLSERPSMLQVGGIVLVVLGGYALEARGKELLRPLRTAAKHDYNGTIVAFLILLSLMAVVDKWIVGTVGIPIVTYVFWLYLFLALYSFLADYSLYRMKGVGDDLRKGWKWLAIVAFAAVINILLFYKALSIPGVLVSLAVPLRRVATLIETVLGGALFHEDHVWRKAAGCAVMLVGVLLIV